MYRTILIPIDGSEGARRGAEHALDLAEKYTADVHALYVIDQRIYGETPALSTHELVFEELENEGQNILEELTKEAEPMEIHLESAVRRGIPHEQILEYAKEHKIDLIVMGRHGRAGHSHTVLGSTSDPVLRLSDIPVLQV